MYMLFVWSKLKHIWRMENRVYSLEPLSRQAIIEIEKGLKCSVEQLSRSTIVNNVDVQILICRDRDDWNLILYSFPNLRFIFILSVGVEKLPFDELIRRNIQVANPGGINAGIMSEYVMASILAHSTRLIENINNQRAHVWKKFQCVDSLSGKTLLIIGAGRTGKLISKKAKAFNMNIIGIKKTLTVERDFDSIYGMEALDESLSKADYVVCTIPLTKETEHLFNYDRFSKMKTTGYFINISRGGLVVQTDLVKALNENIIGGSMLDVFVKEPLESCDALWDIKELTITPHSSGRLENFIDKTVPYIIDSIDAFIKNEPIPNKVNLKNGY